MKIAISKKSNPVRKKGSACLSSKKVSLKNITSIFNRSLFFVKYLITDGPNVIIEGVLTSHDAMPAFSFKPPCFI